MDHSTSLEGALCEKGCLVHVRGPIFLHVLYSYERVSLCVIPPLSEFRCVCKQARAQALCVIPPMSEFRCV
jgi:hypothetical protein